MTTKQSLKRVGLDKQPIPVVVGPLNRVAAYYLVINDRAYEVPTAVRLFEITVKICHSLDCHYPPNANSLWVFLQRVYCNIVHYKDKVPIALRTLIGEIEKTFIS